MSNVVTARVTGAGTADPGFTSIIVAYQVATPVGGAHTGETYFLIDQALTDQEIEASLRTQLAEYLTQLAGVPGVVFTDADIRGCRF